VATTRLLLQGEEGCKMVDGRDRRGRWVGTIRNQEFGMNRGEFNAERDGMTRVIQ